MLANWETSRSEIPAHLIPVIAAALDVSVTDLLPDLPARPQRGRIYVDSNGCDRCAVRPSPNHPDPPVRRLRRKCLFQRSLPKESENKRNLDDG
jgi:hypothetical protein